MLSHVIKSRPTVAAVYRLLPAPLDQLIASSALHPESTRNAVKLLLATKQAYASAWTVNLSPIIAIGSRPNVPRPTAAQTRHALIAREKPEQTRNRTEYQRAYREAHAQQRADYNRTNSERLKVKRRERVALKKALGLLVPQNIIKTTWITL